MSRDIRSFFIRKNADSGNAENGSGGKGSKKRALRVIDSDSDDEVKPLPKKPKEVKSDKKKTPEKKEKSKDKSSPVNISSFYGTSPVVQKPRQIIKTDKTPKKEEKPGQSSEKDKKDRKKKRKKGKNEESQLDESFTIENDDDFDETLKLIDDNELEKLTTKTEPVKKETEKKTEAVKKTPVKENKAPTAVKTPGSVESKKSSLLDSEQKRKHNESYQRYLNRGGPKNPGSKEIPKGTPNCLQGLTFVISGVLDSLERDEAVDLIQKCGGRVTGSVSGKTNYIVVGEEAGQSKLEKASKFGTKKLTEDDLLDLIRSKSVVDDDSGSSRDNFIEETPKKDSSKYFKNDKRTLDSEDGESGRLKKVRKAVEIEAPKFKTTEKLSESSGYESQQDSQERSESSQNGETDVGDCLWVDKYKPKSTKQIIGQAGDKSNVKKLIYWLENWSKNHLNSATKKAKPAPWQSNDGSAFKAALLSGPPGVGKTTSVHLVCKELGLDIIEYNASDTRSKKLLQEEISELLNTKSIRGYFQDNTQLRQVLVMDEVDGMAGNEDRGGIQELILVIKKTKIPIICMCNDRSHPKMRSLVNYCFDLRYPRPRVEQIKGAMMSVCFKEGLKIPSEALEEIIINANQDVRQVLHNLSLWTAKEKVVSKEQAKKDAAMAKKPTNLGPWDVARKVFSASEHSSMTLRDKEELFFQDYNLGPLFVQDTYIRVKPIKAKNDKKATLNLLSKAADALVLGDIVERTVRSENAWTLLPVQAIFSSVLPGHYMEGHVQGQIQFPVWLGKNSKRNRFDRILQELQSHMRLSISAGKEAVNLDYLHVLRDAITRPLLRDGADGVSETLQIMSDYNLTKDDLDNIMELALWPGGKDVFAGVDSKVKAALTRSYNKEGKLVPFATSVNVRKVKSTDADYDLEGGEEDEADNEEVDDDLASDAMIKKGKEKKKEETKAKGSKKEKPPKERKKK
ncbi:UNVERIFIED_CONTAM: hypothetical protein PYX00_003084 [Menopon gallinae]|uniref:Replication factor C subunit 1 n=1 Tax=Menopon gallinae TaxID=328185 RepID=A0AAW2I0U8_9NEOP